MTAFTPRIHRAFDLAAEAHNGQTRKDPDKEIPAMSHLACVAYILAQQGFDEDTVVAGVLHDIHEDVIQKGRTEYEKAVRNEFGERVYELIGYVTQQKKNANGEKIAWEIRGSRYAERLAEAPAEARAISCADKIHNIQSMLLALDRGVSIMDCLNAGPDQQLKKFENLHRVLSSGWSHPILDELEERIALLRERVRGAQPVV